MAAPTFRKVFLTAVSIRLFQNLKCSLKQNEMKTNIVRQFYLSTCRIKGEQQLSSVMSTENERQCWKCQKKVAIEEFVCSKCESLQSPNITINHFKLFKINETFDVDIPDLMRKFKDLQRKFHPDKFSQKSKIEQDYSAIYSAQINRAYQTLLKPYPRGCYILETKGKLLKVENITMSSDFLAEIMEINEVLADTKSLDKIKEIAAQNAAKIDKLMKKLSQEIKKEDWDAALITLAEMKYYANIDDRAKQILNEEEIGKI